MCRLRLRLLQRWISASLAPNRRSPFSILAVCIILAAVFALPSLAQQVVLDQMPMQVRSGSATLVEHYNPTQMLRLVIVLQPPHVQEEEQFLNELQDKNSLHFHQYLSEAEANERFSPSVADEQAVAAWAQSQGLSITQRFPNRLLVDVEAPVATIEKALNVTLNSYQLGQQTYFSNDRGATIPSQLSGKVQAILGLNNFEVAHPFSKNLKNSPQNLPVYSPGSTYTVGTPLHGDGDPRKLPEALAKSKIQSGVGIDYTYGAYDPTDIYSSNAYDYQALNKLGHCCNPLNNPGNSPPDSSIAIAIINDYDDADIIGFAQTYPYLAYNVQRYWVDGHPQCCDGEATMDTEWTTAMANSFGAWPNTSLINVYEGTSWTVGNLLDVINRAFTDGHARVLSMSWGSAENYGFTSSSMNSFHSVFNQMLAQGWTLVAASGDSGPTTDCADHLAMSYPASDPDVTAAGGTTLSAQSGSYMNEVTWTGGGWGCVNNDGGSGGGCSAHFAAPPYQTSTGCGNARAIPDIALNADWLNAPQNVFFDGYLQGNGGTSVVAPEIAGFYAQENAYLLYVQSLVGNTCGYYANTPCAPMGNANYYLYGEGYNQPYSAHYPFYDIVSGCNANDITNQYGLYYFCAVPGLDQATGWGSANMLQLAWTINTFLAGDFGPPTVSFSGPPTNRWYNTDQTVSWTIADTTINGHPPNGIAGFSALWDADPGDVYGQPTPGTGNSFYTGPQTPNSTSGSLDLVSAGFGCHTMNVRAWDNAGQPNADSIYGPVCYDTTAPVTIIALSGQLMGTYYVAPVLVTLTATDDLSGIASTLYQIDSGNWQNYSGPFNITALGPHTFTFYSVDNAGNIEAPQTVSFVVIGTTKNALTISRIGTGGGTVTSTDGDINCGATCTFNYYDGTPVTLMPAPNPGSVFAGWSGCDSTSGYSCTVVVLSNRTATVTFNTAVAYQFVAMSPCRVVDTRNPDGPFGGPPIQGGTFRTFPIPQGSCSIPTNAAAYSFNVTVVPQGHLGFLTVWPSSDPQPSISTMNSLDGRIKADAAIVPAGTAQAVSVFASGTTDVILDINGYFISHDSSTLAFFTIPDPCRVIDTRTSDGPLGGPYLIANQERDFPVLSSNCNIPAAAQAYSFNVTAVPHTRLGYLTVWPQGQSEPTASTLNATTGAVTANAAIVQAGGNGQIAVVANDDTDLVVDINGYFAPPGSGANPLNLYNMIPCRALDTRETTGEFTGQIAVSLGNSPCALTSSATAYVLNATVVPDGHLGYLTLWPTGQSQPQASTLNATDGAITSNMAIVLGGSGSIDAYASGWTQLILDISSYFGP